MEEKIVRRVIKSPSTDDKSIPSDNQKDNLPQKIVTKDSFNKDLDNLGIDHFSEEEEKKLLSFVNTQIERMNNKLLFNGNQEPSFYELDMSLATYEQTLFGVIALYESAKFDADIAAAKYDEFYAEKYMDTRNTYNTLDTKKSCWLSATEIDATTRTRYKKELAALKAESIRKDCEKSTLERMLRSWESYQFVLAQLSKNSIAEAQINGLVKFDMKRGDETDEI